MEEAALRFVRNLEGKKLRHLCCEADILDFDFAPLALHAMGCTRVIKNGDILVTTLDYQSWDLSETMAGCENFRLVPGDILQLNIPALAAEELGGLRPLVCANLPYHITTPILTALVEAGCFESITVMIQKEVAERIAAAPGPEYGAFSVFMQYHTEPRVLFEVPRECFLPAPKVTSAVLHCPVRPAPAVSPRCGEAFFFRTVRAAFAQRRKTLINSLSSAFGDRLDKGELREAVISCGLPETVRGERLGLAEFAALSDALADRISGE